MEVKGTSDKWAMKKCYRDSDCAGFTVNKRGGQKYFVFYAFSEISRNSTNTIINSTMELKWYAGEGHMTSWLNGRVHHKDAMRCFSWSLGWVMTRIPGFDKEGTTDDDIGEWSCTSVHLRVGSEKMLGQCMEGPQIPTDVIKSETSLSLRGRNSTKWVPRICEIINAKANFRKEPCSIAGYELHLFDMLRTAKAQASGEGSKPEDITSDLLASIRTGPIISFDPGVGLRGSTFASTWDGKFKLKMGIRDDRDLSEPLNLMDMLKGERNVKQSLMRHLELHPESFLNRYYGLLKIDMGGDAGRHQWVLWMADASWLLDQRASVFKNLRSPPECVDDNEPCLARYDLKGRSRHQRRLSRPHQMFTLANGEFRQREFYRLDLNDDQCYKFRQSVEDDAHYLQSWNLIDYSYFIIIVTHASKLKLACKDTPLEPLCFYSPSSDKLYTISLIDWLNDYSLLKMAESIRSGKFDNYSGKIQDFAEKICPYTNETAKFRDIARRLKNDKRDPATIYRKYNNSEGKLGWPRFKALLKSVYKEDRVSEWKRLFQRALRMGDPDGRKMDEFDFVHFFKNWGE